MVGKTVCSRKIATQYQADQIILVKVGAEKFTRTIEWGGIGDHMHRSSEGWGGKVHQNHRVGQKLERGLVSGCGSS